MTFAEPTHLANELGVDFSEQQEAKAMLRLAGATAAIQRYCRLTIELATSTDVIFAGNWGADLVLPEVPVVSVASVEVDGDTWTVNEDYHLHGRILRRGAPSVVHQSRFDLEGSRLANWGGSNVAITVTYTHGFDPVPDDIRLMCVAIAARGWDSPSGVQAESIGNYSVTHGASALLGGATLTRDEKVALKDLRRQWIGQMS